MSLSKEQKRELGRLSEYFKKIEKLEAENKIDLDVFMTEYNNDGFEFYVTERINIEGTEKRKEVFERESSEKSKTPEKKH